MASYFRQVPDFQYINRTADAKNISDYQTVKNLFKRGKLKDDIFGNLSFFTKYQIIGNERPDNVAYKFYEDSTLDWVILLANNILNIQSEWPIPQSGFDNYLIDKYETYENLYSVRHYETKKVINSNGITIVPEGLIVPSNFSTTYYDDKLGKQITQKNITVPVTNYQHEQRIDDEKRNIFVLKPIYLNVIFNDTDSLMKYKKGGDQYVNPTLKKGDNIRLYL